MLPASTSHLSQSTGQLPAQTRRTLSGIQQHTIVKAAQIRAAGFVAAEAMHEVVMLTELEVQLSALCPAAAARLQVIGNLAALDVARTVRG